MNVTEMFILSETHNIYFCLNCLAESSGAGFNGQNFSAILVFPFSLEFSWVSSGQQTHAQSIQLGFW